MEKKLKIHYLQHVEFEGLGCIEEWISKRGHQLTCTRLYKAEILPDIEDFDWLIIMGGPMGIYDDDKYPWFKTEKEFIKKSVDADKTILGICLGAQLLADALGAVVQPGKNKEIGWYPIHKTDEGKDSDLLREMPDELEVFHWHGDQFDIPEAAVRLAESVACNNQLFQFGKRILALQFHFEATPESVQMMLDNFQDELSEKGPYIQPEPLIIDGFKHCERNNGIIFSILDKLEKV